MGSRQQGIPVAENEPVKGKLSAADQRFIGFSGLSINRE